MATFKSTSTPACDSVKQSSDLSSKQCENARAQCEGIKTALEELERRLGQIYSVAFAGGLLFGDDASSAKDLFGVIEDLGSDRKLYHHIVDRVTDLEASLSP